MRRKKKKERKGKKTHKQESEKKKEKNAISRLIVPIKRFCRRKPGTSPLVRSFGTSSEARSPFRNRNNIGASAYGSETSVSFLRRNARRARLAASALTELTPPALNFPRVVRSGFIVRPEVIRMLIPLCPRDRRGARSPRLDYTKRNDGFSISVTLNSPAKSVRDTDRRRCLAN